ncbi:MAG: hypothetical protein KDE26_22515 [Bacteroidetes bacterium]|nr:hypothetical protein [Bacteroidota bacterium]MCB0846049.1 hypothetical protein [Bacteroidota bacterium]
MKTNIWITLILLATISACQKKDTSEADLDKNPNAIETEVLVSGSQDLIHFDKALEAFDKKDNKAAADHLREAAKEILADSTEDNHTKDITRAIETINHLADEVENGKITSKIALIEDFARAEMMVSHHYFEITEDFEVGDVSDWEVSTLNKAIQYLKSSLDHGNYYEEAAGLDLIRETTKMLNKVQNGETIDPAVINNQVKKLKNFVWEFEQP